MNPRRLGITISLGLSAFLFVFFVPIIYDPTMFRCVSSSFLCLTNPSGWKSLGYWLVHWGAAYSPGGAGDPQLTGYTFLPAGYFSLPGWRYGSGSSEAQLTAFGVLLFVALPAEVACIGLLALEVARRPHVARIRLAVFGASVLTLSALMYYSMVGRGFRPILTLLGWSPGPAGAMMILYGPHRWVFRPVELGLDGQSRQPSQ